MALAHSPRLLADAVVTACFACNEVEARALRRYEAHLRARFIFHIGEQSMHKIRIKQGALWAFTVAKQAIIWAAVRLLGMAILSVVVKTWPVVAVATSGVC